MLHLILGYVLVFSSLAFTLFVLVNENYYWEVMDDLLVRILAIVVIILVVMLNLVVFSGVVVMLS